MANLRATSDKLWLRYRERPREKVSWRDFWILVTVVLLPFSVALQVFDAPLLSFTKAVVFAGGFVWVFVVVKVLTRLGVIEDRPPR